MSFVRCGNHTHWGRYGAAGLLLTTEDRTRTLLQLRSPHVLNPGTWALVGGALERGETPEEAALREAHEEAGITGAQVLRTVPGLVHPRWTYTYVLATTPTPELPRHESWEASDHAWVLLEEVADTRALHRNLAADWPRLHDELRKV